MRKNRGFRKAFRQVVNAGPLESTTGRMCLTTSAQYSLRTSSTLSGARYLSTRVRSGEGRRGIVVLEGDLRYFQSTPCLSTLFRYVEDDLTPCHLEWSKLHCSRLPPNLGYHLQMLKNFHYRGIMRSHGAKLYNGVYYRQPYKTKENQYRRQERMRRNYIPWQQKSHHICVFQTIRNKADVNSRDHHSRAAIHKAVGIFGQFQR